MNVPCNGCTLCCKNELLFLHPEMGDREADYETQPAINPLTGRRGVALKVKLNGDCHYLGVAGCTIHGSAPAICRAFDCRKLVQKLGGRPGQRRALATGEVTKEVLEAGKARLSSLDERTLP